MDVHTSRAFYAVENNQLSTLKKLIENGVHINCHNNNGDRLLVHAMLHHAYNCMTWLTSKGADIITPCPNGHTPLTRLCAEETEYGKQLSFLLQSGAEANTCNVMATSPLLLAVQSNNLLHVKILLQNGADTSLLVSFATNILTKALVNRQYDIAQLLIDFGANVNMCDWYDISPLLAALRACPQRNDRKIYFPMLIDAGAHINSWSGDGNSPFLQAIFNHDATLVEYILMKGNYLGWSRMIDPEIENNLLNALDIFCSNTAVNNINLLFFGCGERCNTSKIYNKHPIIYRMQKCGEPCNLQPFDKPSGRANQILGPPIELELQNLCRRTIRCTLRTCSRINLHYLVHQLPLPSGLKDYVLFKC